MHISMAFVNPGDEVLVPDPGYPTYSSVTNLVAEVLSEHMILIEEDGWLPNFNTLEDSDLSKVKMMWVNYPHMPSGTRGSQVYLKDWFHLPKHIISILCNDNPYSFILNKEYQSILSVDGAKEFALELNSLSKSHNMAGWRLGMVAGHKEYIKNILRVKCNMDSGMFLPIQMAAVEALNNPPEWYERD